MGHHQDERFKIQSAETQMNINMPQGGLTPGGALLRAMTEKKARRIWTRLARIGHERIWQTYIGRARHRFARLFARELDRGVKKSYLPLRDSWQRDLYLMVGKQNEAWRDYTSNPSPEKLKDFLVDVFWPESDVG